jgi:hypothetical protein
MFVHDYAHVFTCSHIQNKHTGIGKRGRSTSSRKRTLLQQLSLSLSRALTLSLSLLGVLL